jgi:O-antigen/teichoic acid export membrane protein
MVIPIAAGLSLDTSLAIWIVVSLLRLVVVPIIFRQFLVFRARWWDREILRTVWGYLWPMQLARLPVYLTTYLDKVIMSLYLLPRDFAVYSLGARELPFVGVIAYSVSSVLLPHLVEDVRVGNIDQICRRWRTSCVKTALVTYVFAGFAVWNASAVMRFLFSSTYEESSIPFRIFAMLTYLRVVEFGSVAKAFGRTKMLLYAFSFDAILVCVLGLLLTPRFGVVGMALAVVTAEIAANILLLATNKRMLGKPLHDFFPWGTLLILLLLSIASSAVASWAFGSFAYSSPTDGFFATGYRLGILFVLSVGIYLVLLRLTRAIGVTVKF